MITSRSYLLHEESAIIKPGEKNQDLPDPQADEGPPPPLSELFPILCLGPDSSQKLDLIKLFANRDMDRAIHTDIDQQEWTVDYFKKDISFDVMSSTRLQFHLINGSNSGINLHQEWPKVLRKKRAVVVFLALDEDIAKVVENLHTWKEWIDQNVQLPASFVLTRAEALLDRPAIFWIRLGAKLQSLCIELDILDWYVTSMVDDTFDSIDAIMRNITQRTKKEESSLLSSASSILSRGPPFSISVPQATASTRTTPSRK